MLCAALFSDPCEKKKCGKGRECSLTDSGEATCTCVEECTHENDPRRQVSAPKLVCLVLLKCDLVVQ